MAATATTSNATLGSTTQRPVVVRSVSPSRKSEPQQPLRHPGLAVQLLTAGSAACVADLITFPLDTAKVRLQVQGEASGLTSAAAAATQQQQQQQRYKGVVGTVVQISKNEGFKALYNGIVPGLQRQMAFSSIRIGAYEKVKQIYTDASGFTSGVGLLFVRMGAGITTGCLAILSAQPTDVVKIRMQAEVIAPGAKSRYDGVIHAYKTVAKEEGLRGLYKGTFPNIARTCIINVGEIVVYDVAKESLIKSGLMSDGIPCHFSAAIAAGFTATLIASPVDVIKTRFMNSPSGKYRGAMNCAVQTWKREGFFAFYKGFNASFTRLVAWNICLWLTYEQMKKATLKLYNRPQ